MANQGHGRGGSGNFANDRGRASEAGRKGGQMSGGNFAKDPQRASEAGRKGGQQSGGGRAGRVARQSGANDPERAPAPAAGRSSPREQQPQQEGGRRPEPDGELLGDDVNFNVDPARGSVPSPADGGQAGERG